MSTLWGMQRSWQARGKLSRGSRILQESGQASEPGLRHVPPEYPEVGATFQPDEPGNSRGSYPRAFATVKAKTLDV